MSASLVQTLYSSQYPQGVGIISVPFLSIPFWSSFKKSLGDHQVLRKRANCGYSTSVTQRQMGHSIKSHRLGSGRVRLCLCIRETSQAERKPTTGECRCACGWLGQSDMFLRPQCLGACHFDFFNAVLSSVSYRHHPSFLTR